MRKFALPMMMSLVLGLIGGNSVAFAAEGHWYESPSYQLECPGHDPVVPDARCDYVGQVIWFEVGCSEQELSRMSHICGSRRPTVQLHTRDTRVDELEGRVTTLELRPDSTPFGRWGLAAQISHFGVPDADLYGGSIHGLFRAKLGDMVGWQFRFEAGPGATLLDEEYYASVTSAVAVAYEFDAVALSLGARHEIVFEASGDALNSVFGGLALDIELTEGLNLNILANFGAAFYAASETTMSLYGTLVEDPLDVPADLRQDIETSINIETEAAFIYRIALGLSYTF